MKLYHPDSSEPVDCHPSKVDDMLAKGWTTEEAKPASKSKSKSTDEVKDDG